jgi:hypothetical protein
MYAFGYYTAHCRQLTCRNSRNEHNELRSNIRALLPKKAFLSSSWLPLNRTRRFFPERVYKSLPLHLVLRQRNSVFSHFIIKKFK